MTSFEKYLLSLDRETAVTYLIHCLNNDNHENEAWVFMKKYHGHNWSLDAKDFRNFIRKTLMTLEVENYVGVKNAER